MNEITKLYENAGIKPIKQGYCDWDSDCPYPDIINNGCGDECPYWKYEDEAKYPPFTAEKQITILITLANYNLHEDNKRLLIDSFNGEIYIGFYQDITLTANATDKDFAECVAKLVNNLWQQDLTEEDKTNIKNILEM